MFLLQGNFDFYSWTDCNVVVGPYVNNDVHNTHICHVWEWTKPMGVRIANVLCIMHIHVFNYFKEFYLQMGINDVAISFTWEHIEKHFLLRNWF